MFLSLLQIPAGINFDELSNMPAGGAPPEELMETIMQIGGAILIFGAIFLLIGIVIMILNLINVFHWGMTDNSVFVKAGEDKKKWYTKLIIIPIIAAVVGIVPILGWIASIILYIYWVVMTLMYFFSVRKKLTPSPTSPPTPTK